MDTRRLTGILLILIGIGILVASDYILPNSVHKLDLGQSSLAENETRFHWIPYISVFVILGGIIVLLSSHRKDD